jgi:hypothetical protein
MFPVKNGMKQGDALSPLVFNLALERAIRRVKVSQDGFKLNGAHQFLVSADDVNILGGGVHTIRKKTEALVVASKEMGLEGSASNTNYIVMSRDHSEGRSHNKKIDNSSFVRVEQFRYLGTTNQKSVQEEIRAD